MGTKKEDRAKNPFAGVVAFSGFQIDPAIAEKMALTDEHHAVIGKVIVHWSQIEADTTSSLMLLKGLSGSEEEVLAIDNAPLLNRIRQIYEPAKSLPNALSSLAELEDFVDREKWKRDTLAHGSLLFDMDADPSFFLVSRKMILEWDSIPAFEAESARMRETARRIFKEIILARHDRNGTPLHWVISNFTTSTILRI